IMNCTLATPPTPPEAVADSVMVPVTVASFFGAVMDTVRGPPAAVTVTLADADLVISACETAATVTVAGLGTAAGAVYSPDVETVPTVALPPVTPFTCQVTAVLLVPVTVAVNCCVVPTCTDAEVGAIETATTVTVRVTVVVWLKLPLVPVMVSVEVPAGVELVVETLSVELPEPPLIEVGLKVPVAPVGKPLTLNDTAPVKLLRGETLAV
ncbi:MAG: hypothetical protein ACRD1G_18045, partial [Acidimicrobiales bacterium]